MHPTKINKNPLGLRSNGLRWPSQRCPMPGVRSWIAGFVATLVILTIIGFLQKAEATSMLESTESKLEKLEKVLCALLNEEIITTNYPGMTISAKVMVLEGNYGDLK